MAGVAAEAEAEALLGRVLVRTVHRRRRQMQALRRWVERLERRDTLRQLPAVRRLRTRAAPVVVAEWPQRETGRRMTRPARHGSLREGRGTLGITTFPMRSDGR